MKKTLIVMIALLLIASLMIGCAGNDAKETTAPEATKTEATNQPTSATATEEPEEELNPNLNMDSLYPVVNEKISPSLIINWRGDQSTPEEMFIFKWFDEACNVKFDVTPINASEFNEKYNIILNTGEVPDVTISELNTSIMTQYFYDAEMGMDMWPYIEKYAPDMKLFFDNEPAVKAMCSIGGKLLSLPQYRYISSVAGRNWINQDFLDTLDLEMPTTLAEFKDTLVAFRDLDPNGNGEADEIAFGGSWEEGYLDQDAIWNAFGWIQQFSGNDMFVRLDGIDGSDNLKMTFMPLQERYKDYLVYMNDLWNEGLMDPDIFTQSETASLAKIAENRVGFAAGGAPYVLLPNDPGPNVNDYIYQYQMPMTSTQEQKPMVPLGNPCVPGYYVISAESEYADALVRLANLAFNWDTATNFFIGPDYGSELDIDENHLGAIDYINPENPVEGFYYPHKVETYPDLTDWQYELNYVAGDKFRFGFGNYALSYAPDYSHSLKPSEERIAYTIRVENGIMPSENPNAWSYEWGEVAKDLYGVEGIPVLYLSAEDNARIAELRTAINDIVKQMSAKIITGAEPISAYDTMVADLIAVGAEEYEQIFQKYYNAYYGK